MTRALLLISTVMLAACEGELSGGLRRTAPNAPPPTDATTPRNEP